MDLNSFITWQGEKSTRSVTIRIGDTPGTTSIEVFAYDYETSTGQHVTSVGEINLSGEKERRERAEYEALKKKFEGESE